MNVQRPFFWLSRRQTKTASTEGRSLYRRLWHGPGDSVGLPGHGVGDPADAVGHLVKIEFIIT